MSQLTVYGDMRSGNCYKIALLCELLGQSYQWQHVDILKGEAGSDQFLAMNPNGKIPVLRLADGRTLSESNAILNYLAEGTAWLPDAPMQRAQVLQWQFFEQYSHEPYIAVARFINLYLGRPEEREAEYVQKQAGGHKALSIMEQTLSASPYLVEGTPTIADLSLYAYTHVAHEGGFDLTPYPAIGAWLDRLQALPGYASMAGPFPNQTAITAP